MPVFGHLVMTIISKSHFLPSNFPPPTQIEDRKLKPTLGKPLVCSLLLTQNNQQPNVVPKKGGKCPSPGRPSACKVSPHSSD